MTMADLLADAALPRRFRRHLMSGIRHELAELLPIGAQTSHSFLLTRHYAQHLSVDKRDRRRAIGIDDFAGHAGILFSAVLNSERRRLFDG